VSGKILQVNISRGGIPKRAIDQGNLTVTGFEGDSWAHPQIHGGPQQIVLLIASESIEFLRTKGFPVYPGALGENLTTEGLAVANWRSGQQYQVGQAVIEFTKVRTPCSTLDIYGPLIKDEIHDARVKAKDFTSPKWALSGFYARVIKPGLVFPGNPISLLSDVA
jgi:MOSC domain-containing protein YiiM